ncbi:phage late control D family protein [Nannocystis punicea]|uniref:Phage protein D n=1 Tax=Nannocystis punicea TaxID=2995304 RepID=A0ABY7H6V9_9BACT|nr:hypothetical protein [Nannocystis poenicansa]WAS94832.1 hypothetical protein O0S08_01615 [Nannocystis poenicansa]
MAKRVCVIRVDGREIESLYEDMIALEVCEREAEPSTFALKLGIFCRPDSTWTHLDDGEGPATALRLWQRVTVEAGFEGRSEILIDGYIAGLQPEFGTNQSKSSLLVWGHDVSYSMQQEEKVVAWEDRKFSDVAAEIFESYGLEHEVEDSRVVHALDDNLLMQRGTDWDFLNRLAAQLGYELFVRGAKGYFRKPKLATTPQRDIAIGLGYATANAIRFKPKIVGDRPSRVRIARIDPIAKTFESLEVAVSPQQQLGREGVDDQRAGRSAAGRSTTIAQPIAFGSEQEMESFAEGVRRHHDWIVQAEGELDGKLYGAALRARAIVPIRGAGRQFSGDYYVTKVVHRFTLEEYRQRFWVQRNATEEPAFGRLRTPREQEPRVQAKGGEERVETRKPGREVAP